MAGRYHNVTSVRFSGDRARGHQHLPAARVLMGQVMEQAGFNGLTTHRLQRIQADGSQIIAEKIGNIARLSIRAPWGASGQRPVRVFDDLLVTGGIYETENGQRVRLPVIVSHNPDRQWQAYFAHNKALGYYPGAGTYGDVFPALEKNRHYLRSGNCYQANSEGIVTSWISAAPFICPKARHPVNVYGNTVYCLGMGLLSFSNTPWKVLCAVIDEGYLYVLISQFEALTYPLRPTQPGQWGDAWASHYYSHAPHDFILGRYRLKTKVLPHSQHHYYAVDANAGKIIQQGYFLRCYNRWTFDNQTKQFVTVQLPLQPILRYERGELVELPSNNEAIVRLGIDGSLTGQLAQQVIFEENGQQIRLEPVNGGFDYVTPTRRLAALRASKQQTVFNAMMYANPATDAYVLCRTIRTQGAQYDYMVAWDKGKESVFSQNNLSYMLIDMHMLMPDILPDMTGSGIATLCYGAVGWVHYAANDSSASQGIYDRGHLTHSREIGPFVGGEGIGAGGLSVAGMLYDDGDVVWRVRADGSRMPIWDEDYSPRWTNIDFFNQDTSDPVFVDHPGTITQHTATGHGQVLVAYRQHNGPGEDSYLTGADLNALTGNAFDFKSFCPLGKPHPQQPREVKT